MQRSLFNNLTQFIESSLNNQVKATDLHISLSNQADFDYQINGAMRLAKLQNCKPRDYAQQLVNQIQSATNFNNFIKDIVVSGPGFINIALANELLIAELTAIAVKSNFSNNSLQDKVVVIDYSSPNIAKEMHVGHLRGTVIGDCISRVFENAGATVIRQNHVGDWGTQFGMLIEQLKAEQQRNSQLKDLEQLYLKSKQRFDSEADFVDAARKSVVALQSGDLATREIWQKCVAISMQHCQQTYQRLGVKLQLSDVKGESSYNEQLPQIKKLLTDKKLLRQDKDAFVVFLPQFTNKNGDVSGIIIQKADGGYLYMTTDIAAMQYRLFTLKADKVLYFIDVRQSLHIQQLFAIADAVGWLQHKNIELNHCAFGTMTKKDGTPFKTREGNIIKLNQLLDEGIDRTKNLMLEKGSALDSETLAKTAETIAIASIKYADLSKVRTQNYIFEWDKLLSFEGNTAPYLLYAYTRINQIILKSQKLEITAGKLILADNYERKLAMQILQYEQCLEKVLVSYYPHELCNYLFNLATVYMQFYEQCPVLTSKSEQLNTRITLCKQTAKVLKCGLDLLGIEVVDRM